MNSVYPGTADMQTISKFFKGFVYAASGIKNTIKEEQNMRFHLCVMVLVIFFSFFYELDKREYAVLFLTFSSVLAAECMNTAIENAVDNSSREKTAYGKKAKDAAAGAVLISAAFSVITGIILFWDTNTFKRIFSFFWDSPEFILLLIIYLVCSYFFVFGERKK